MADQVAVLAGGCFWCTEAVFRDVIGVSRSKAAISAATSINPTYKQVCGGDTGHAEAIRVTFDPDVISYGDLLDIFFATHDPTQLNRQGNDVGTQYRSAIFPHRTSSSARGRGGDRARQRAEWRQGGDDDRARAEWYPAEDYHQEYWEGEGQRNPYCLAVIPPKLAEAPQELPGAGEERRPRPPDPTAVDSAAV